MKNSYFKKCIIKLFDSINCDWCLSFLIRGMNKRFLKELEYLNTEFPCNNFSVGKRIDCVQNIVVVRLDAIGDMVWTTSIFKELRATYPSANIDLIIRPQVYDLVSSCPYIDTIYKYDCNVRGDVVYDDYQKIEMKVKSFIENNKLTDRYDLVILPRELFFNSGFDNLVMSFYLSPKYRIARSYSLNKIQRIKAKMIANNFSAFVEVKKVKHEVEQLGQLMEVIGCKKNNKMELWPQEKMINFENLKYKRYIVVGLQGSSPNKNYKTSKYNKVFRKLYDIDSDVYFVLCGDEKVREAAEIARKGCKNVIDIAGETTLNDIITITANSIGYIGSDTGLTHIAAALGKPIVEISAHVRGGDDMSEYAPSRVGPYGVKFKVLEIPYSTGWCLDECIENKSACINRISESDVVSAIKDIILE